MLFNYNFIFSSPASRPASGGKKSGRLVVQPPSQRRLQLLDSTLTDPFEERRLTGESGQCCLTSMIHKTPEDVMDVMLSLCHKTAASDSRAVLEMEAEGILRQLGTLFLLHLISDLRPSRGPEPPGQRLSSSSTTTVE